MGNRGNIQIQYENGKSVYFYTHWRGDKIKQIVQKALQRKLRWNDESYLARIIFCELVRDQESEETGFGISPYLIEESSPLIKVNPSQQKITVSKQSYSFSEYVDLTILF